MGSNDGFIFLGAFLIFYVVILLVSLAFGVLQIIAQWKLFEKAGEKGWTSIIPVYNYFQMIKIATGNNLLGWVYIAICGIYMVVTAFSSFILEFSSSDEGGILYILMMLCMLGFMIPLYIIAGYVSYMFGKSYGKPIAWNVCMIFFSPIMMIIMGFDKNTIYIGPKGMPKNYT